MSIFQGEDRFFGPQKVQEAYNVELLSKELNYLVAILHVYAGGLNFMK